MTAQLRRRFRSPVFSRLTLAWTGACLFAVALAAAMILPSVFGEPAERITLPVEGVDLVAPAPSVAAAPPTGGLRLAAPGVPAPIETPDTLDTLAYPDPIGAPDSSLDDETGPINADDIVITIAGSEKRVTPVTAASLGPATPRAAPVPDPTPALLRDTSFGKIPRRASDGRAAMHYYRNPFDGGDGRPKVALIVGGLGLNKALTETAIDNLPANVSLSFAPYAKDLDFWTTKARRAGHEVLIELPMEHYNSDPAALGAAGLLTSRSPAENLQRLDWLLSRFGGYFAATNYMGGKFAADSAAMAPVLAKLNEVGVGYFDDTGAATGLARRTGAAVAPVTRVLPPAPDDSARRAIRRDLDALVTVARQNDIAVAKAYAFAPSIEEIVDWARALEDQGVELAPASAALPLQYASR